MGKSVSLHEVIELAQLSLTDKIRLIERIAPQIEHDLRIQQQSALPPLRGLWKGLDITAENIQEIRIEMEKGFAEEAS